MRILGPIVLLQALLMASRQSHLRLGRAVRAQFVGHQHIGREALFLEQLAHQFHGCSLVAPSLHQEIEDLAFIVDRAPEPEPPARNRHGHLVEMPPLRWPRASTAKFASEQQSELQDPSPHCFVRDIQSTLSEQIFDVAITEGETNIEPNCVSDDRRGELMAGKRYHAILPAGSRRATVAVTKPAQQLGCQLLVTFAWREKEGAAFPGTTGQFSIPAR